jgi:phosphate transport system protein
MERHFELELEKLNKRINKMGSLVYEQVHMAMTALVECNGLMASEIIEHDNEVDELDVKIDKLCQRIFALTQPVATDLRLIMASLKMNNDLERMGDHAVGIAKRIESLSDYKEVIAELKIAELASRTDLLVKDVVNMITSRNTVFVRDIFSSAIQVKEESQSISSKIIEEMMKKSEVVVVATNLMLILTQMERIAGYAMNVAESMVFLVEGRIVKHSKTFKEGSEPSG